MSSITVLGTILTVSTPALSAAPADQPPAQETRENIQQKQIERFMTRMQKELALTPAQTTQIRALLRPDSLVPPPEAYAPPQSGHRPGPGMGPRGEGMPFGEEFLSQLRSDKVDTAALNREFAARQAAMKMHHDKALSKFVQIHALLTAEQRTKLADLIEKRRDEQRSKMRERAAHRPE